MKIKAYAKINLTLDILEKSQKGYHHIQTLFQQINLFDELTFKKLSPPNKTAGKASIANANLADSTPQVIIKSANPAGAKQILHFPHGAQNTVFKAIKLLQQRYPKQCTGIAVLITKNIPLAAGLGGGSADAAATLKALNRLWKLKLSPSRLQKFAAQLGMDCPFFIKGGTAFGTHFGEKIRPLRPIKMPPFLLILPKQNGHHGMMKISTATMYKKMSTHPRGTGQQKTKQLLQTLASLRQSPKSSLPSGCAHRSQHFHQKYGQFFHNDFEILYTQQLTAIKKRLYQMGATGVYLTGSGPALFTFFKTQKQLRTAHQKLGANFQTWMIV